ncbi:MAG: MFS transporter [Phycisphaerae bacterium]|nr:MFS transporter [Phycisphaerae bacterium]
MTRKWQLPLFFCAVACMGCAFGIHESIFNNFLSDTFDMSAGARGWLEFPRELPGLLVVLMAGILCAFPLTRVAVVGALVFAGGMLGMGLWGTHLGMMLTMMVVGSAGMHLIQPVRMSVALALSDAGNRGRRIGQTDAVGAAGLVLGTAFVWLVFGKIGARYGLAFTCAAVGAVFAAAVYFAIHIPELHPRRAPLVVRKRYSLYYVLEFLFGARKQIFLTFGPWVLIQVYGETASGIARLLMIASIVGVVFKPVVGAAIDRFGERVVMITDGVVLSLVCVGYGYALVLTGDAAAARVVASACFIADNLLFALGTSRAVYLSRLTDSPQELNSTLAMGVSVNHIASMTIPAVAGMVWISLGYERVFAGAAVLALGISAVSTLVPGRGARGLAVRGGE